MRHLTLLLFIIPTILLGQGWEKIYESGRGNSVRQTTDGGYIITGTSESYYSDIFLIKTDEDGDTLWTKTYGGNYIDGGSSVQQTSDGGFIIIGYKTYTHNQDDFDVYLIKTDNNGDTTWTKTYGGQLYDFGYSVQQTTDGGYIVAGVSDQNYYRNNDVYLVRTDEDGYTLWTKTYGGDLNDYGYSVQQTTDGGYIITGATYRDQSAYGPDVYLIKTDEDGDTLWTKTYGSYTNDTGAIGYSVQQTTDGGYIITGIIGAYDATYKDVYLIKTDESGDTLWTKKYGKQYIDGGYSVQQTMDGGYIITGYTILNDSTSNYDVYLIKTNDIGDTLWTKTYGGQYDDRGSSVQQTTDGGYIITGWYESDIMDYEIYLIKTDDVGNIVSTIEIPTPNSNRKLLKMVDLSGKEIIKPRKNAPFIEIYDNGTTQKKMIIK